MSVDNVEILVKGAPTFQKLILSDCAISVCDHDGCRGYFPGEKLNHGIKAGDPLLSESAIGRAIELGEYIITRVGSEVFGFPYLAVAVPVLNKDGEIIGGVSLSVSLEREEQLLEMTRKLQETVKTVSNTGTDLSAESEELAAISESWGKVVSRTVEAAEKSKKITEVITNIGEQTNLLALNAAIEAARHGEKGKAFGVVADEMRKLVNTVDRSAENIKESLDTITSTGIDLNNQIKELEVVAQDIADAAQQLASKADEIDGLARHLLQFSGELALS